VTDPLYRTPGALEGAIKAKAKTVSAASGVGANELIRQLSFQRFLARVFTHDPDGWMLKGGQALLVRYPAQARNSRDIDLYRPSADSVREAVDAISAAAATRLDDYYSFTLVKTEVPDPGNGAKLTFQALIGTHKFRYFYS
jgi:hypothetical protein